MPRGRERARPRVYERLTRWLIRHAAATGLGPGDRLPGERELATRLGVSRASIRQAMTVLQVQGIVRIRQGDGTYLRRIPASGEFLSDLVGRRRRLPEVLEARSALEASLAALAARRRTHEDIEALRSALATMEDEVGQGNLGVGGDEAFHRAVTRAAHNDVLRALMDLLAGPIEVTRLESLSEPGRPPQSLTDHRAIAAAIERGDAEAAAAAMRRHIAHVGDVAVLRDRPNGERP
jgi:GntR family transcriptional regulator, transcriptional repressor for pyruvate dehydrogenase complex